MKNSVPGRSADSLGDITPLFGGSKVNISELTVATAQPRIAEALGAHATDRRLSTD